MKTYTLLSNDGLNAIREANRERMAWYPAGSPTGYPVVLSETDFDNLISVLALGANTDDNELSEWATNYLSGIANTLGIELI